MDEIDFSIEKNPNLTVEDQIFKFGQNCATMIKLLKTFNQKDLILTFSDHKGFHIHDQQAHLFNFSDMLKYLTRDDQQIP